MTSVIVTNMGSGAARSAFLVIINNYPVKNINKSQDFLIKQIRPYGCNQGGLVTVLTPSYTRRKE